MTRNILLRTWRGCLLAMLYMQLSNTTDVRHQSTLRAAKCFIVWNDTAYNWTSWNDTVTRRLACPDGWTYDRQPIETSIVTDVSIDKELSRDSSGGL